MFNVLKHCSFLSVFNYLETKFKIIFIRLLIENNG